MESWDRIGLVILLVVSLVILGMVLSNASISGYSIANLFKDGLTTSDQGKSIMLFTILLLVGSVITILVTYFIHAKND
ncbi:hypothetical protein HYX18_01210 [Candidatus Woesearchaeota archaeon]|nr:hypothetical protein [Candidatus Woesearchaeota archaeon]